MRTSLMKDSRTSGTHGMWADADGRGQSGVLMPLEGGCCGGGV